MDTYQFFASLAGSVAWPAAVAVSVYILRNPLRKLMPHVKKISFGNLFSAEFGQQLKEAKDAAAALPSPPEPLIAALTPANIADISSAREEGLKGLAKEQPDLAVVNAWTEILVALNALWTRSHGQPSVRSKIEYSPLGKINKLAEEHVLDGGVATVLRYLESLRHRVVLNEQEVSEKDASEYIDLVFNMKSRLDAI